MELETYEANLADIALQEQTFYDIKPTQFELELAMASQLASTLAASQNCQNGPFVIPSFPIAPIISNSDKGKKKKSVKFLTYVQVSVIQLFFIAENIPHVSRRKIQFHKWRKRKEELFVFHFRSLHLLLCLKNCFLVLNLN